VAVLTLALGIGANTAIFSVVNAVLLQPLPYQDSSRLVAISQVILQTGSNGVPVSFTKFSQIREQARTLESTAAYYSLTASLVTEREPEAINGARVSNDFFKVLRVPPVRGRSFLPEEEQTGAADVAVISDGFWHSHFGGQEDVLGRNLSLDGKNVTIVGVLPASFKFPLQFPEPDVWLPRVTEISFLTPAQIRTGAGYLGVVARLRDGESIARAQAELDTINGRYKEQFGNYVDATRFALSASSLEESLVGALRPSLLVLLAAVGFVLLIACANVANLLLARATSREREIAVRKALGASRMRLIRQMLSESLLLSLGGGVVGVLLAMLSLPALRALSPGTVPRLAEAKIDPVVLVFSLVLCCATGIIFGLIPSLQAAGKELQESLKEGSRGSSEGGSRGVFRAILVVGEIAVALLLMTVAGLLMDSFARLMQVNPGFSTKNLMTFPSPRNSPCSTR